MRRIEKRRLEMLRRVRRFGEVNRDTLPRDGTGGQAFDVIDRAVALLEEHGRTAWSAAGAGVSRKAETRTALLTRMQAMERCGRLIARANAISGTQRPFCLPPQRNDRAILMVARTFLGDAERFRSDLIGLGMAETCVTDLRALVNQFERAIAGREDGKTSSAQAIEGIAAAFSMAQTALATLDVVVANRLHDDEIKLAEWESERRVGYPRRTRRKDLSTSPVHRMMHVT